MDAQEICASAGAAKRRPRTEQKRPTVYAPRASSPRSAVSHRVQRSGSSRLLCVQVGGRRRGGGRERAGVAFAWDWHDRQAPLRSFRVGPCTAAPFAWRSCCLVVLYRQAHSARPHFVILYRRALNSVRQMEDSVFLAQF